MFYSSSNEYNDCVSHGACSLSPNISSVQEIFLTILKQTAFYINKLMEFGLTKYDVLNDIIYVLAFSDSVKDLSDKQILELFSKQYKNLLECKNKYKKICKEKGLKPKDLRGFIKLLPTSNLSDLLKLGEQEFLSKYKSFAENKKYLSEILISVLKSMSLNLVNLSDYSDIKSEYYNKIISALNIFNSRHISSECLTKYTNQISDTNIEIFKEILERRKEKFGDISYHEVSLSTVPNKAIMVSGTNLNDLDNLLKSVENTDIDVYTNGNLLFAHAFQYFRNYKNLKGHFGNAVSNTMLDFATFPGAILLTKNEAQNIEYLYRGRLFTTDKITPKGVAKLDDNNFKPVIESAIQAKGFAKGQTRESKIVGYNLIELKSDLKTLISDNPERIFIIGHSNLTSDNMRYFNEFFNHMPDNNVAISFAYNPNKKNVLYMNLGFDFAVLYEALQIIFDIIPINSDNLYFYLTKCGVNSLSNIINLKNRGAKNIYLSNCPPMVINPAVLNVFRKMYDIKTLV